MILTTQYHFRGAKIMEDEIITQQEVLELMGVTTTNHWSYFNNLQSRGHLEGFPEPLKQKVNKKNVYNKARVLEWLNGKYTKPDYFGFLTGKYDQISIQNKRKAFRRIESKIGRPKPKTVTVRLVGDW